MDSRIRLKTWIPAFAGMTVLLVSLVFSAEVETICPIPKGKGKFYGPSQRASLSRDGRFVVFESKSSLVEEDKDKNWDLYLYDREEKNFKRIRCPDPGRSGASASISGNAQFVAFHAHSKPQTKSLPPKFADIFLYDIPNKLLQLVTPSTPNGALPEGENLAPILNDDGDGVLFTSNATTILPAQKIAIPTIYYYDVKKKSYELISQAGGDVPSNRVSGDPKISRDSRFVTFKSAGTNLVRLLPANSLAFHLYLLDRSDKSLIRIDETPRGFDPEEFMVGQYDLDDEANIIVFEGRPRQVNSPLETLGKSDLFIFNRSLGSVKKLTEGELSENIQEPSLSGDGRYLACVFNGIHVKKKDRGLFVFDLSGDIWKKVLTVRCRNPIFSKDGSVLVFESDDPLLSKSAKADETNLYVLRNPFLK